MAKKSDQPQPPPGAAPRYMTLKEAATELGFKSRGSIYNLIYAKKLTAVSATGNGRNLRVTRASFDAYCRRLEDEAAQRLSAAA